MMRTETETMRLPISCEQADCSNWKNGWKFYDTSRAVTEEYLLAINGLSDDQYPDDICLDAANPPVPRSVAGKRYQRMLLGVDKEKQELKWVYVVEPGQSCADKHWVTIEASVDHYEFWDRWPPLIWRVE